LFKDALGQLLGFRPPRIPLDASPLPIIELNVPSVLRFCVGTEEATDPPLAIQPGDTVEPGGLLGGDGDQTFLRSPVWGSITAITREVQVRGNKRGTFVHIAPSDGRPSDGLSKLDLNQASVEQLGQRIRESNVMAGSLFPKPLIELLWPGEGHEPDTLIVLVADREPGVSASRQLFLERNEDVAEAAKLLGRVCGTGRVQLAVLEGSEQDASAVCEADHIEILVLPAEYPESLEELVALRAKSDGVACVVTLEAALAALDAVRDGKIQQSKVLTLIGPEGEPLANYRVPLGTAIGDVLHAAGVVLGERDKVVAGGPMRGFAQYALSGAVDAGVDAITVVAAKDIVPWTAEPCVNCGHCIDACPLNLQVQLIGRYAEFSLFERTVEFEIAQCIECGLCAAVCTGRRPLLQWIRLAKQEVGVAQ